MQAFRTQANQATQATHAAATTPMLPRNGW